MMRNSLVATEHLALSVIQSIPKQKRNHTMSKVADMLTLGESIVMTVTTAKQEATEYDI